MVKKEPKEPKGKGIPPWIMIGGLGVLGLGAIALLAFRPSFNTPGSAYPFGFSMQNPLINNALNTVNPVGTVPGSLAVQPPLSVMETGGIIPAQQNVFCDPTLGLNWDPLQGKCVQRLQGQSGQCAPGSVFNNCQCQCVPSNVPQPQCYRDCTTSCTDQVNQQWSWCVIGCIPKSAAYGNPGLLACPPLQGRVPSQYYPNLSTFG